MTDRVRRLVAFSFAICAVTSAHAVHADLPPEQAAARRDLIEQAQASAKSGDHVRALDLANRAASISSSPSLRRFLADEYVATGQVAQALGSAELCMREANAQGAAAKSHFDACSAVAEKMRNEVGYVVVTPDPSRPSMTIKIGGIELPPALHGQRYAVTPGRLDVDASAPGFVAQHVSVLVEKQKTVEQKITLLPEPAASPTPVPPATSAPTPTPPFRPAAGAPPANDEHFVLSPLVPIGAVVAGVGVGFALGFGISGQSELGDYEDRCTVPGAPAACKAEQADLQGSLDTRAVLTNVSIGVAIAGAGLAVVGAFLSGNESDATLRQALSGTFHF